MTTARMGAKSRLLATNCLINRFFKNDIPVPRWQDYCFIKAG
jgi:hypothetical protein